MKILVIICGRTGAGKELVKHALIKLGFVETGEMKPYLKGSNKLLIECVKPDNQIINNFKKKGFQVRIVTCEIVNQ